jgi:hypothetical protein
MKLICKFKRVHGCRGLEELEWSNTESLKKAIRAAKARKAAKAKKAKKEEAEEFLLDDTWGKAVDALKNMKKNATKPKNGWLPKSVGKAIKAKETEKAKKKKKFNWGKRRKAAAPAPAPAPAPKVVLAKPMPKPMIIGGPGTYPTKGKKGCTRAQCKAPSGNCFTVDNKKYFRDSKNKSLCTKKRPKEDDDFVDELDLDDTWGTAVKALKNMKKNATKPKNGWLSKSVKKAIKAKQAKRAKKELNLDVSEDAVCAIKACPPKCSLQNIKVGEEENVDQDVEADLQTMQKFGFVKKAVKAVVQWIKKKVCVPDAACISANQKCQATLDKLHASLNKLTSALAAAAAKASAAKGSSAAAAALAAQLDKQTAALKEVLKADTEAMEAAETEMTALKGQADQASADAKTANGALAAAVAKHAALVKVHQKSKQAALDAAAKAAGANSSAAKAAAAYKAAVAAHTDTAGQKAKVAAQLGM